MLQLGCFSFYLFELFRRATRKESILIVQWNKNIRKHSTLLKKNRRKIGKQPKQNSEYIDTRENWTVFKIPDFDAHTNYDVLKGVRISNFLKYKID